MSVRLGSTVINNLYVGSAEIKKLYLGSTLVHDTTGGGTGNGGGNALAETGDALLLENADNILLED